MPAWQRTTEISWLHPAALVSQSTLQDQYLYGLLNSCVLDVYREQESNRSHLRVLRRGVRQGMRTIAVAMPGYRGSVISNMCLVV